MRTEHSPGGAEEPDGAGGEGMAGAGGGPRVLCAGDGFISSGLLARALDHELPGLRTVRTDTDWPTEPFTQVQGVGEASGDPAALAALVRGADALVTHLAPVTADVIAAGADTLQVIGVTRGGPVNVDTGAAARAGIPVLNLPGRNLGAVAEYCVGAMITSMRGLPTAAERLSAGEWDAEGFRHERTGPELRASTVGLVGVGAVGRRVAELLRAFGSTVLAHDPYADPDDARRAGVRLVALPELLAASDVVSLHARLTDETRHMIDADALSAMRPGAVLVNTARGELVDTRALDRSLASGHLRGAALDVFDPEPPAPDDPLLSRPQVWATPHLAGASTQVAEESASRIAREVAGFLRR